MSSSDHPHGPGDDLAAYFSKSASAVQCYADHFEQDVDRPAFANSHIFFKERPITATLVAIFSLLSFLPVLAFVGMTLFAMAIIVLVALLISTLVFGTALVTFLSLLLFALFVNLFIALFLTGVLTFAYMLLRLAILVRERGTDGIYDWVTELQGFVLSNGGPHHFGGQVAPSDTKPALSHRDSQDETTLDGNDTKTQ